MRALHGTALHFCEVVVLKFRWPPPFCPSAVEREGNNSPAFRDVRTENGSNQGHSLALTGPFGLIRSTKVPYIELRRWGRCRICMFVLVIYVCGACCICMWFLSYIYVLVSSSYMLYHIRTRYVCGPVRALGHPDVRRPFVHTWVPRSYETPTPIGPP